jgi:hypothetical protein
MPAGSFFIQISTGQSKVELMAECPKCGAVTYVPLAYAWTARSVACCECGTQMPIGLEVFAELKMQAVASGAEIERLMSAPRP